MKINDKVDFSDTMNLPKKTIATNADLPKKETFFLARIQDVRRYREVLKKNESSNTLYNILENPVMIKDDIDPTCIQNKILKDIVIRYRLLNGNKVNHNIDFAYIYNILEDKTNKSAKTQELIKKRELKKKELSESAKKQIQEIKNLGTIIDYGNFNSSTLNSGFEARVIDKFWKLYNDNKIYHKLRPVSWCAHCNKTPEREDIKRENENVINYFLNFKVSYDKDVFKELNNLENTYFVANVTKPWVLDFDNNLSVIEDMEYSVVEVSQNDKKVHYIISSENVDYIMDLSFFIKYEVKKKVLGSELIGMTCKSVVDNAKDLQVIPVKKEYIMANDKKSSGISIISSGNLYIDYLVSKENIAVKINNNLTKEGKTTMLAYNFKNMDYKQCNTKVIEMLKQNKRILCTDNIQLKISRCKECNEEVILRSEQVWYLKKTADDEKLKQSFDSIISKISQCSAENKDIIKQKLYNSIKNKEKVISSEDNFGIPLPMLYCAECSSEVITEESISTLKNVFNTRGIESWFKETPEEIFQGKVKCNNCGCTFLFKGSSTINSFFKYMCIPLIRENKNTNNSNNNDINKIDICIENYEDFIRKIISFSFDEDSLEQVCKINNILLHSKVNIVDNKDDKNKEEVSNNDVKNVDNDISKEKQEKKSKTFFYLGKTNKNIQNAKPNNLDVKNEENVDKSFNVDSIVKKYGIDILRLWCIQRSNKNSNLNESSILYTNRIYRKIRSTIKFIISNISDFNPIKNVIPISDRDDLDKYMYIKLYEVKEKLEESYNNLDLYNVFDVIYKYCREVLCGKYFNIIKFRLYVLNFNDKKRRSTQSTLYEIFMTLLKFLEPIIPFTFEETWTYIWHNSAEEEGNILLTRSDLKLVNKDEYSESIKKWDNIFFIIKKVNEQLKKEIISRKIKNSLQAKVILGVNESTKNFIDSNHEDFLRSLNVSVLKTEISDDSYIKIEIAEGMECKRCKNYSQDLGKDIKYRYLCPVCSKIMNERNIR